MSNTFRTAMLADLLGPGGDSFMSTLNDAFSCMEWAEDEIKRAQKRHPAQAMQLYHAFKVLNSGEVDGHLTEPVFRAHCHELLERVVAGKDTTLPTNAQICLLMAEVSQRAPLTTESVLVYMRAFNAVFPGQLKEWDGETITHYEAVAHDGAVEEIYTELNRKLRKPERVMDDVICQGMHHGEKVNCPLDPTAEAAA